MKSLLALRGWTLVFSRRPTTSSNPHHPTAATLAKHLHCPSATSTIHHHQRALSTSTTTMSDHNSGSGAEERDQNNADSNNANGTPNDDSSANGRSNGGGGSGDGGDGGPKEDFLGDLGGTNKLYLTHVNWCTGKSGLDKYFRRYGRIKEITMFYDAKTGLHSGFAELTYESARSAATALRKRPHVIHGDVVVVDTRMPVPLANENNDEEGGGVGSSTKEQYKRM